MDQDEVATIGFDFVNDVMPGETLSSAVWTVAVVSGTDANPMSHLQGPTRVITPDGSTQQTATVQGIGGLLPGVVYRVRALASTNLGNVVPLHSHIFCEEPL